MSFNYVSVKPLSLICITSAFSNIYWLKICFVKGEDEI